MKRSMVSFLRSLNAVLLAALVLPGYAPVTMMPCVDRERSSKAVPQADLCITRAPSAEKTNPSPSVSLSSTTGVYVPLVPFPPTVPRPPAIDNTWPLTFEDHFDAKGVDWTQWRDGGKNFTNGGNGELQQYIPTAYTFAPSLLRICAKRESVNGRAFTSGELNTKGVFQQAYGYFEIRAQLPKGQGLWPAFWLYDASSKTLEEIDVMENLGKDTNTYYMTVHDDAGQEYGHGYHGVDLAQGYHRYAVKWTPEAVIFYLDDVPQHKVTGNIVSRPMAIFLNLAVGGHWPGSPDSSTPFPSHFNVDYVRAWAMPAPVLE